MYEPQLRDIALRCKNTSTADLSRILDSDALSIIHINARSLKQNFDDIVTFGQKYMIDSILITETWLDPALAQGYRIHGYEMLQCIPDSPFAGKGCTIYIKNDI